MQIKTDVFLYSLNLSSYVQIKNFVACEISKPPFVNQYFGGCWQEINKISECDFLQMFFCQF